jgi:hypothetical protein
LLYKTKENIVASVVDVASLFVAYQLGVQQLGPIAGIGYGLFDAWIVVWQRERISSIIHKSAQSIKSSKIFARRKKAAPLPWMTQVPEQIQA